MFATKTNHAIAGLTLFVFYLNKALKILAGAPGTTKEAGATGVAGATEVAGVTGATGVAGATGQLFNGF
jgi:hypothetical protein